MTHPELERMAGAGSSPRGRSDRRAPERATCRVSCSVFPQFFWAPLPLALSRPEQKHVWRAKMTDLKQPADNFIKVSLGTPDRPSWVRAFVGFVASTLAIIAAQLFFAAI